MKPTPAVDTLIAPIFKKTVFCSNTTSATAGRISSHSLKSDHTLTSKYNLKTTGQNSSQEKEHAHRTTSEEQVATPNSSEQSTVQQTKTSRIPSNGSGQTSTYTTSAIASPKPASTTSSAPSEKLDGDLSEIIRRKSFISPTGQELRHDLPCRRPV